MSLNERYLSSALACAAAAFAACAAPRLSDPSLPSHGGLVIAVSMESPELFGVARRWPASIELAKVGAGGALEPERHGPTFKRGSVFGVLDLPAGRYALTGLTLQGRYYGAVEAGFSAGISTTLAVVPGRLTFAGELDVVIRGPRPKPGELPARIRRIDTSVSAEVAALETAREPLAGTLWAEDAAARLAHLGKPRAPVTRGFWRWKKTLPVTPAAGFSYVDVLNWRGPFKVAGGLEWRQKKDKARIAVSWLQPGMAGYMPLEKYLPHLRSLGREEDEPIERRAVFGGLPAYVRRYTTYYYPEGYEAGTLVKVFMTETWLVPRRDGHLLLHYRAERRNFQRYYKHFERLRLHVHPAEEKAKQERF